MNLIKKIKNIKVDVPLIFSGGVGKIGHIKELKDIFPDEAVAIASALHYNNLNIGQVKKYYNEKICILDYGLGNIRSLYNSIKIINSDVSYYSEIKKNKNFDILFIPGVGSFNKASKILKDNGYFKIIEKAKDENIKIVGICLGMHILFSEGYEDGRSIGLNFIKGSVRKIENTNLKLPNIGWKKISIEKNIDQPFFKKFDEKNFILYTLTWEILKIRVI